jgi:hypothetical protein
LSFDTADQHPLARHGVVSRERVAGVGPHTGGGVAGVERIGDAGADSSRF